MNVIQFPTAMKTAEHIEYILVKHVAYGCGCVRTFHVEQLHGGAIPISCPDHGDGWLSSTEELRRADEQAA